MSDPRPDFLIIGGMKCATTTLHEQLAAQPGFFMTEPKEPYFFSNDEVYARGWNWYAGLFDDALPGTLRGESSTHYTKLPTYPLTVRRIVEHLGRDVKCIYIMRHPVDRLVSQYVHEWTMRHVSDPIDEAIDRMPELVDYSRYSMQLTPFFEAFGPGRVLPVLFERFTQDGPGELQRICRFLGYDRQPQWLEQDAANVSTQRMRASPIRDALVFNPVVTAIRKTLVPQSLRDWVKGFWQMKRKPQLSPDMRHRIEQRFDEDLLSLGRWLGVELTCANWKTVAAEHIPRWQVEAIRADVPNVPEGEDANA